VSTFEDSIYAALVGWAMGNGAEEDCGLCVLLLDVDWLADFCSLLANVATTNQGKAQPPNRANSESACI
jgi:hypothetical protein